MTEGTEAIVSATKSRKYGDRRQFVATVELHKIGNQAPYFSAQGEDRNLRRRGDNQVEACGQLHDEIVKFFPQFAPVVKVHLADEHGVPMHAEANALYWGGFSTWGGNEWRQMVPDDDYGRRTLETDETGLVWAPETFANHLRVSVEEGRRLREYVANDPSQHYSAAMHFICQSLRKQWQSEADKALQVIRDNA